jgi:hypothetical protein
MTRWLIVAVAAAAVVSAADISAQESARVASSLPSPTAPHALETAFVETAEFGNQRPLGLRRMRAAGAASIRTSIGWSAIAPRQPAPGSNRADPANPAYRWAGSDVFLRQVTAAGLRPDVAVFGDVPEWARSTSGAAGAAGMLPKPRELRLFMTAAARHYNGATPNVPRVDHWQLWVEPNVSLYFRPQTSNGRLVSPALYRELLAAFAAGVRAGNPEARVIAGGLSPFGRQTPEVQAIAPLRFMRELLCMSRARPHRPTCRATAMFDIWSHHPYTSGGPTRHAIRADDVSLGDLPEMRALLNAAVKAGHVRSSRPVEFWVTEFGWDSSPPDPKGIPSWLHARWMSEGLYRMWKAGVSYVAWIQLRDLPFPEHYMQAGLYFREGSLARDRPKPALRSFRFPFVALPERGRTRVWGRTPWGRPAQVLVQRRSGGRRVTWRTVARLQSDRFGVFTAALPGSRRGTLRARIVRTNVTSPPFATHTSVPSNAYYPIAGVDPIG